MLRRTLLGATLALLLIGVSGGTAQAGSIEFAALHGTKVDDLNGDGFRDAGEPGIPGWSIHLRNTTGSVMLTTATDADGNYWFTDLEPGSWELSEALAPGWVQTFPTGDGVYHLDLNPGEVVDGLDFLNRQVPEPSSLLLLGVGLLGLARKRRA